MRRLNQCKHVRRKQSTQVFLAIIVITLAGVCFSCSDSILEPEHTFPFKPGPILINSNISGSSQLWSMEEDGSDVKQLTDDPEFPIAGAQWSPDGSKIAFRSYAPGIDVPYDFTQAIYVMNADGSGKRRLTNPPVGFRMIGDGGIVWSPDGTKIAFSRHIPPEFAGHFVVFIIDLETKTEKLVSDAARSVFGWFPEGDKLLVKYRNNSLQSRLGVLDTDGNFIEDLTPENSTFNSALLSPDGSKIALSSSAELFTMDSDGRNLKKIKDAVYADWIQTWSPDSDRILYIEELKRDLAFTPTPRYHKIIHIETKKEIDVTPFDYHELYNYEEYREKYCYITSWRRD